MTPRKFTVLPHEYAFNAFLLLIAVRLSAYVGPLDPHALAFFAYLTVGVLLIPWCNRHPTTRRWRARLIWYPIIMGISFFTLNQAVWLLDVPDADPLISRWDVALLGAPATTYVAPFEATWLTEGMMAAYLFFFYYLIFGPLHYWLTDLRRFRNCFVGLFVLYALGFLGYSFLPAGGPHIDPALAPLHGGPLTRFMLPLISVGSNHIDVFPSIHGAASLYLLLFDYANYRKRFWILLVPTIALWISTVYLRYHYVVDLLGGALFMWLTILAAPRLFRWWESRRAPS
jgi:membrane-associated phospholipid phosphatase